MREASAGDIPEILDLFEAQRARSAAAGHTQLMGERLIALDLYLATFEIVPAAAIAVRQ